MPPGGPRVLVLISPCSLSSLCSDPPSEKRFWPLSPGCELPGGQALGDEWLKPRPGTLPLFIIYLGVGLGHLPKRRSTGLLFAEKALSLTACEIRISEQSKTCSSEPIP